MSRYNIVGLFCDDIREEKNDRYTLVGVYPDNVLVTKVPGAFAKLGIYVRVLIDPQSKIEELSLKLRHPNGEEHQLSAFELPAIEEALEKARTSDNPYAGFVFNAVATPAPFSKAGRFMVIVKVNEEEVVGAFLNVQAQPTST